jgi:hypothetical protein
MNERNALDRAWKVTGGEEMLPGDKNGGPNAVGAPRVRRPPFIYACGGRIRIKREGDINSTLRLTRRNHGATGHPPCHRFPAGTTDLLTHSLIRAGALGLYIMYITTL